MRRSAEALGDRARWAPGGAGRRLRVGQVLSQRDLAARAGVAANTIAELEAGKRQAYPATVRKLAQALGVHPQELLEPRRLPMGGPEPRPGRARTRGGAVEVGLRSTGPGFPQGKPGLR